MRGKNRSIWVVLALVLVLSALLSQLGRPSLELHVEPLKESELSIRLLNRTGAPVKLYNSLQTVAEGEPTGFTSIRLRDAAGEILSTRGVGEEGFWTYELSQTKKVPVVLETLLSGQDIHATTNLKHLVRGFDEEQLARAVEAQVRCVVFLEQGLLESRSVWIPFSSSGFK